MAQSVAPSMRIIDRINESDLVTLKGSTHHLANAMNDRGRVERGLLMTDLILVLSRTPVQQAAFDRLVAGQNDPDSPDFQHWLTPEEVGAIFGPSETDIAIISDWLAGHGFSIDQVTKDRMSIRFSGTAAQVESAFHTEIHNLEVKGVHHIGNMSDPQIPAALAPVVVGVKSLHNFFARPLHRLGGRVTRDSATGNWRRETSFSGDSALSSASHPEAARPLFGVSVPASGSNSAYLVEDVSPYDFATIYGILPLWNASTPIDGTGQTIAIAGTSAIDIGTSVAGANGNNDVTNFRSTFGLPAYSPNQLTMLSGNSQPLTVCTSANSDTLCGINDLIENSLDVEWAGAIAKGANIVLVASYPASSSDDNLYDSESYIVNNKTASIMSVSYGVCELYNGTAANVLYNNLWQTAASEGIAVFVASGNGGSASCDVGGDAIGNPYSAQFGLSVNGLASTPYNTAVGGTDFNWCSPTSSTACTAAPYWHTANAANGSSAAGYVPEVPWNDSCANPLAVEFLKGWATAVNITGVTDAETACNFVYNYWSVIYQDTGGSNGGVNLAYFVDTIGAGGGASRCVVNDGATVSSCSSTIATTGTGNGSLPLVPDGWPKPSWQTGVAGIPNDGVRDLPDVSFFASDGLLSSSAYLICVSALDNNNAACSYSTTSEPFAQEAGGTSLPAPAMAGVMALINQRAGSPQGSPNAELYKLAAKQTYSSCSAENATTANGCYFNDIDTNTIAMPCDYGATEGYPVQPGIQSPDCSPEHSGDLIGILSGYSAAAGYDQATGLGSLNIANVVNAWPLTIGSGTANVTVTPAQSSVGAGSALSVTVTVAAASSGGATPTGVVTLSGGGYSSAIETLASGTYTFTIPANSLSLGRDTLTASYSGDSEYTAATGTATVTVISASATFTLSATTPSAVAPGTSATSTLTVATSNGYVGTATLSCALTSSSPSSVSDPPSCSIASSTEALTTTASSANTTITVTTTAATTGQLDHQQLPGKGRGNNGSGWMGPGGAALALLFFLGIPAHRRGWRSMLCAIAAIMALGGLAACKGFWDLPGGTSTTGTTAGTYTFTVTGTGNPQVAAAVTTTFTVTVN
ncbi:MAG: protease pro-enzyme activation domain-containing protein [Terracidiphilus sp.]